jgi:hypothetical protein
MASTRSRVAALTLGSLFTTREAVERETPLNLAISSRLLGILWERSHKLSKKERLWALFNIK